MKRALILTLLLTSCAVPHQTKLRPPAPAETVRELLRQHVQSAGVVPRLEAVQPPPPKRSITLAWENGPGPTNWTTGLEATTDFTQWHEVARLPYAIGESRITMTNRPSAEFYRAFNSTQ